MHKEIKKMMMTGVRGIVDEQSLGVPKAEMWQELELQARSACESRNQKELARAIGGLRMLCWHQPIENNPPSGLVGKVATDIESMFKAGDGHAAAKAILKAVGGDDENLSSAQDKDELKVDILLSELISNPEEFEQNMPFIMTGHSAVNAQWIE